MKFTLCNLLLANMFMAASLGLLLSDGDTKLKRQAAQQRHLIEQANLLLLPISQAELDRNAKRCKLNFQEASSSSTAQEKSIANPSAVDSCLLYTSPSPRD